MPTSAWSPPSVTTSTRPRPVSKARPALIRRLGVVDDGSDEEAEEHAARIATAEAALEALDVLAEEEWARPETVERMRGLYRFRRRRFATLRNYAGRGVVTTATLASPGPA